MQKKIIALAVAGLMSGAAFAQSNVTVYGIADAYFYNTSGGDQKTQGIGSGGLSGSRLGFKGVEDLGGGLKAVFTLEYALAVDSNAGIGNKTYSLYDSSASQTAGGATTAQGAAKLGQTAGTAARQQFVGLSGGFGTVVAGRLQTPGYNFGAKYDALAASAFSPMGQLTDGALMTISGRDSNARVNNAVAYVSPNFSGVTAVAAYAFGEQTTGSASAVNAVSGVENKKQSIWALAADYDNGPLSVGFVYHDLNNLLGIELDQSEWGLGGAYDFGVAKIVGSYQKRKVTLAGAEGKDKVWNLGVVAPVGAGNIHAAYSKYSANDCDDCNVKAWSLAYTHNLSKRTTAYVGYSRMNGDAGAGYETASFGLAGLNNSQAALVGGLAEAYKFGGITPVADKSYNLFGAGVRHSF